MILAEGLRPQQNEKIVQITTAQHSESEQRRTNDIRNCYQWSSQKRIYKTRYASPKSGRDITSSSVLAMVRGDEKYMGRGSAHQSKRKSNWIECSYSQHKRQFQCDKRQSTRHFHGLNCIVDKFVCQSSQLTPNYLSGQHCRLKITATGPPQPTTYLQNRTYFLVYGAFSPFTFHLSRLLASSVYKPS